MWLCRLKSYRICLRFQTSLLLNLCGREGVGRRSTMVKTESIKDADDQDTSTQSLKEESRWLSSSMKTPPSVSELQGKTTHSTTANMMQEHRLPLSCEVSY